MPTTVLVVGCWSRANNGRLTHSNSCAADKRRLGFRKTVFGLRPLHGLCFTTICQPWSLLRKALIWAGKSSVTYNVIRHTAKNYKI